MTRDEYVEKMHQIIKERKHDDETKYAEIPVYIERYTNKHMPVIAVGSHESISTKQEIKTFKERLFNCVERTFPELVMVYGGMPNSIIHGLENITKFRQIPDWTTFVHQQTNIRNLFVWRL